METERYFFVLRKSFCIYSLFCRWHREAEKGGKHRPKNRYPDRYPPFAIAAELKTPNQDGYSLIYNMCCVYFIFNRALRMLCSSRRTALYRPVPKLPLCDYLVFNSKQEAESKNTFSFKEESILQLSTTMLKNRRRVFESRKTCISSQMQRKLESLCPHGKNCLSIMRILEYM